MTTAQNPNAYQIGGTHYTDKALQPWDAMQAWMSPEAFEGFLVGNAIKYLARYKAKNGLQDVLKARHYLDKLATTIDACEASGAVAGVVDADYTGHELYGQCRACKHSNLENYQKPCDSCIKADGDEYPNWEPAQADVEV